MRMNFKHSKYFGILTFFFFSFLCVVVSLTFLRLGFFARNYPSATTEPGLSVVFRALLTGLRFDASVAGYSLMIPLIIMTMGIVFTVFGVKFNHFVKASVFSHSFFFLIILILQSVNVEYYRHFGSNMTYRDLQYLSSPEVYLSLSAGQVWSGSVYLIIIGFLLFLYIKSTLSVGRNIKLETVSQIPAAVLNIILTAGILIVASRGGIGLSNLNWGSSVISADEKINDAAINPIFAIGKSYDLARKSKKGKLAGMYDGSEIDQGFIASYIIGKEDCEKIPSENVFRRVTKTGKERKDLNVVLILLEGWNKKYEDSVCESIEITPFFDQLSEKSIDFTNCYATGPRSNKGIESVICSVPCQFGISALKRIEGRKPYFSIPSILKKRGYSTSFTYGGDMEFDNMKGFLKINGIDRFIGKNEIAPKESSSKWGAFDEDTLLKAAGEMEAFSEPFFSFIYLLSSHEPFDLPEKFNKKIHGETTREKFLNSLNYSDYSLKIFFDEVSKKEFYENTIFVLISDHGRSANADVPMDRNKFHIPFIIFSENEDVMGFSYSIDDVCTQIDVLPTVMGLLGGEYENASWGRNIMDRNEPQFAFMTDGDKAGLLHNGILLLKSYSREPRYYDFGNNLITEQLGQDEKDYIKTILANMLHFSSLHLNKEIHGQ